MDVENDLMPQKVAFVGSFLPRQSQFSRLMINTLNNFAAEYGNASCIGMAVSDIPRKYPYPLRVHFEISQTNVQTYHSAADFLNLNEIDLVCLQYESGLYDGASGSYILQFAQAVKVPVVTVFYQVDSQPDYAFNEVIQALSSLSSGLIFLSQPAADTFSEVYDFPAETVQVLAFPDRGEDDLSWRDLARKLMTCFQQSRQKAIHRRSSARQLDPTLPIPITGSSTAVSVMDQETLPVLKLDHFLRMTDETGMLKSSILSLPDFSQGYATADNARALMFSLLLEQVGEGPYIPIEMQASRHLAFLWSAYNQTHGRFRDLMSYTRAWLDEEGSEETHGLAVWALGMVLGRPGHNSMQGVARRLFESALPACKQFTSLRAWSFGLLGIDEYLRRFPGDRQVTRTGELLLGRLMRQHRTTASPDWPWFEEALTGASASLSQAMIAAAHWSADTRAAEIGFKTLDWLVHLQFLEDGMFVPLGDRGYYRRGGQRARFAQRPTEAQAMISACLEAYRYSSDQQWLKVAQGAYHWFLGWNDLGQPLYDPETGGCCDGILPGRMDMSCSSEALLAFLVAQLEMQLMGQLYQRRTETPPQFPSLYLPH